MQRNQVLLICMTEITFDKRYRSGPLLDPLIRDIIPVRIHPRE